MSHVFEVTTLVDGQAEGMSLVLDEPLSLWGGLDPHSGRIIDQRHPQMGEVVSGRVLILPSGKGSSSASSILLEAVRENTAPAAIVTAEMDGILALGAVVAQEIYGKAPAVVVLSGADYKTVCKLAETKINVTISNDQLTINC